MKKLLIAILIAISVPGAILAEDVSVDDLLGDSQDEVQGEEITQNVEDEEQERVENIENELSISIPDYTDNPSHIITFKDPSEDKVGVELDVDESGYKDINSPYSLPSLSIGKHKLKFRFVDSIGATKVLEYDIIIIPRPPILKAPTFQENSLILSGTGLANSEVVITVSVGASNYTQIADIDGEGSWNSSISPDTVLNGIYTVFAYTRKNGYASNPSEPAVMEYGSEGVVENPGGDSRALYFDFSEIELENIPNIISQNPDLLITVASSLILGGLIASIIFLLLKGNSTRKDELEVSEKINGKPKEEKTLMEMFGEEEEEVEKKVDEGKKEEKEEKKEKKKQKDKGWKKLLFWKKKKDKEKSMNKKVENQTAKKEKKEEKQKKVKEKTFTKKDFLKDFEKFDPDTEEGEEKKQPTEKEKKDVIVTLTSKVD